MNVIYAQTNTKNYIKEIIHRNPAPTNGFVIYSPSGQFTTTVYYDGLGRPIQTTQQNASPDSNKNIVQITEYDKNTSVAKSYLPYTIEGSKTETIGKPPFEGTRIIFNSNFDENAKNNTLAFYNTEKYENTRNPFSYQLVEASPEMKVLKTSAPGNDWAMDNQVDHTIKYDYSYNVANEVKWFKVGTSWNATSYLFNTTYSQNGYYQENALKKTVVKNENWTSGKNNTTEEFKNAQGQLILKRNYNNNEPHDTYYVYDNYGNLTLVIPPLANGDISGTNLDKLCYQYKYDELNRQVAKKLPDVEWVYTIYDNSNRVILSGPVYSPFGNQTKGWMFNKYDAFDRVVYSGFYSGHQPIETNLKTLRDLVYAGQKNETKLTSNATIDNITIRYSNQVFPTSNLKLLTINYYDDYLFPNAPTAFPTIEEAATLQKVKGLLTGNWTRTITSESSTAGDLSYTLYDYKFRPVSTFVQNHKGGSTTVNSKLNFRGLPTKTVTTHKQNSTANPLTIIDEFSYDKRERLLTQKQTINSQTPELIVSNVYDELGVLVTKNVGGTNANLQKVDYKYNIRGWLTQVNNPEHYNTDDENDLFNLRLNYNLINERGGTGQPLYNGNINSISWKTKVDNYQQGYSFDYDHLNRLTNASFLRYQTGGWYMGLHRYPNFNENLVYDKNGNITHLNRTGKLEEGQPIAIDELMYTYAGNQLKSVSDATNNSDGFNDENTVGDDYAYDSFGNITIDKNKGITSIKYNHLNMPKEIVFNTGKIEYIYDAAGTRLSKKVTPTGGTAVTTDYLGGFQYVNNVLKFFPHTEGYVEFKNNQYLYTYQYKDHLGNVRLTYRDGYKNHATQENVKDGIIQVTEIIDQTDYYPFGLKHNNNALADYSAVNKYKYAYNGKELNDELGVDLYDFGARNYDPALGRWLNVDPLAENSRRWTPYNYAYNNPIYFIDPDGMQSVSSIKTDDILDDVKDKLTFSNGYYDTEFGKSAGAVEHSGFYKNSEFNDGGGNGKGNDRPFGKPNYEQSNNKKDDSTLVSTFPKDKKVLDDITDQSFLGKGISRILDGRKWTDPESGITYSVGDNGKITGFAPVMIGSSGAINLIGGKGFIKITSSVKNNAKLLKYAKETFKGNKDLANEANSLIREVSKGNMNPGIGTKEIGKGVFELRSKGGARVYFNNTKNGINILGYSHKGNQQAVIQTILNTL
nr:DUF6443 domain-containing protein [uncultured Flavobacterium sp.]